MAMLGKKEPGNCPKITQIFRLVSYYDSAQLVLYVLYHFYTLHIPIRSNKNILGKGFFFPRQTGAPMLS